MAWYGDWELRCQRLLREGLLVLVDGVRIDPITGFVAIYLTANEADLPRSNVERNFHLHITLGYKSDYVTSIVEDAVERLNVRWRGRLVRLDIAWMGGGGSAQLSKNDAFYNDADVWWLHSRGFYGNGRRTRVRRLHVSL